MALDLVIVSFAAAMAGLFVLCEIVMLFDNVSDDK